MGLGYIFTCKKCKERYDISLGVGMLSFELDFKKILYVCPECGNWENVEVDLRPISSPSLRKELKEITKKYANDYFKEFIDKVEQEDHNRKCSKCGVVMKNYEDIELEGNISSPKLTCKSCNSKLFFDSLLCWD